MLLTLSGVMGLNPGVGNPNIYLPLKQGSKGPCELPARQAEEEAGPGLT